MPTCVRGTAHYSSGNRFLRFRCAGVRGNKGGVTTRGPSFSSFTACGHAHRFRRVRQKRNVHRLEDSLLAHLTPPRRPARNGGEGRRGKQIIPKKPKSKILNSSNVEINIKPFLLPQPPAFAQQMSTQSHMLALEDAALQRCNLLAVRAENSHHVHMIWLSNASKAANAACS